MDLKDDLYKILFEAIREGLILVNEKGKIVDLNKTGASMFGYTPDELIGQGIEVLVPKTVRHNHKDLREGYNGHPTTRPMGATIKLDGVRKDESNFPVQISLNPMKTKSGENYVITLISDVTERRENEEKLLRLRESLEEEVKDRTHKLRESERLYKSIARNFPSGVISIFDKSYRYLFAEGQGLYELGIETSDLIGREYLSRIDSKAREKVKAELDLVFKGEFKNFEVAVGKQTYSINAVPLPNESKEIDKILVVEKNITAQKEVANKLKETLYKERELADMKSRFVSMASHEFRTPLTTINSSASLIRKYVERNSLDKVEKHVVRIQNSVHNLISILNDFLSFEKLEANGVRTVLEEINIPELLYEIFDEISVIMKPKQTINYIGKQNLVFKTDGQLLKNTLLNLLSNAVKYSKVEGKINVELSEYSKGIKIAIQDFGIGIPDKDQKNLFTRFFRAENVVNIEGTGLGLIIVKRYLNHLNGKINFESKEGEGTTFFIELENSEKINEDE